MSVIVPPIKSQGIKTKLVPWINELILHSKVDLDTATWIEPFLGTGVVGFNAPLRGKHIGGDTNPHIISFYDKVRRREITSSDMRAYLEREGNLLSASEEDGYAYYRQVKKRFNINFDSFDFVFLSRAGFNGMMRFNQSGEWNIPFCKKPYRFTSAYITKICNQIDAVDRVMHQCDWEFNNVDFLDTISRAQAGDLIYCDPPYFGRYADYYNAWTEKDERALFQILKNTPAYFILSTWHHNEFRENEMLERFWKVFNVETKEHFYHSGARIENRHAMIEALVFNFDLRQ